MLCIVAWIIFGFLGIFSAKYREYAKDSFRCAFNLVKLRPCESDIDRKIKTKIISKLLRFPSAARFVMKYYNVLSLAFVILIFASGGYSIYSLYNLIAYGTCDVEHPENCPFSAPSACIINASADIKTFTATSYPVCKEDGKPLVILFSTSFCPHCAWIGPTFDEFAEENKDKITAYHWDLDTKDNRLTGEVETSIPSKYLDIYKKFNPDRTVPTFAFGCKYYRIGTAYEAQNNLTAEKEEFEAVLRELLKS